MTATPTDSQARLEATDVAKDFHALLDADLYLPRAWLADRKRRLRRLGRSGIRLSELRKRFNVPQRCSVRQGAEVGQSSFHPGISLANSSWKAERPRFAVLMRLANASHLAGSPITSTHMCRTLRAAIALRA